MRFRPFWIAALSGVVLLAGCRSNEQAVAEHMQRGDAYSTDKKWAEAIIDGEWHRFDPTAAVAPSRVERGLFGSVPAGEPVPLFARALASKASIVLMDDPMRGVDVGTKQEVYGILRAEAARGRTFVWYTTEMDELANCDHVYVFRNGRIVVDLPQSELSEEKVLHASFEDAAA